jgi:hypothetical protein
MCGSFEKLTPSSPSDAIAPEGGAEIVSANNINPSFGSEYI